MGPLLSIIMVIGYTEREDGVWETIEEPKPGYIVTMAFILCRECKGAISSVGGPRYNSVCLKCYEKIKSSVRGPDSV